MGLPRVGLIGCGRVAARIHLRTLADLPTAELVAVAEVDPERLREVERLFPGVTSYDDWRPLLEDPRVDAVVITLPTQLHAETAAAALEAGKHVYVEKPLATSIEEGARLIEARRASDRIAMVGLNFRFHPLHRELRRRLEGPELGRIVGVRTAFCAAPRELPEWKRVRRTGGGALLDLLTHHADLARFLLRSEVIEASASLRSVRSEHDTATVHLRMEDGVPVDSFVSMSSAEDDRIEIYGERGILVRDRYRSARLRLVPGQRSHDRRSRIGRALRRLRETPRRLVEDLRAAPEPSFAASLGAFVDAVARGGASPVPLEEGLETLAVVLAAEEAARTGRSTSVETIRRRAGWVGPSDAPPPSAGETPAGAREAS